MAHLPILRRVTLTRARHRTNLPTHRPTRLDLHPEPQEAAPLLSLAQSGRNKEQRESILLTLIRSPLLTIGCTRDLKIHLAQHPGADRSPVQLPEVHQEAHQE